MDTSKQRTWWQEIGAISRGMTFIEGSIATPASLLERERPAPGVPAQTLSRDEPAKAPAASLQRKALWLLDSLLLLGGRPETVRHHDDIDEPFPALHRRRPVRERRTPRRRAARAVPAKHCATC
ncbi:MAG: hypothetical protein EOP92_23880 [Lysobacteraceae bacterium]|nr:MAG: hypothetical protein EOP92_23880 [Xanthomonadaceae bacterium]